MGLLCVLDGITKPHRKSNEIVEQRRATDTLAGARPILLKVLRAIFHEDEPAQRRVFKYGVASTVVNSSLMILYD